MSIDVDEKEKYIRSANRQNCEARGRIIRITPAMDAEERYQQKRLGYIKLSLNEMHGIPFRQVFINRVDTRFHQVPRLRAESRRTQTIGWQKLVASTLSSRGTRARNQGENETTSSLGHTTQNRHRRRRPRKRTRRRSAITQPRTRRCTIVHPTQQRQGNATAARLTTHHRRARRVQLKLTTATTTAGGEGKQRSRTGIKQSPEGNRKRQQEEHRTGEGQSKEEGSSSTKENITRCYNHSDPEE